MKLLRLKIDEPFRSLQAGFELHFLREWDLTENQDKAAPYVLAGPNGSGKSNVLELLAAIFYHLDCQFLDSRPLSFEYDKEKNPKGFRQNQSTPDGFELEYLIEVPAELSANIENQIAHIKVVKSMGSKEGALFFWYGNSDYVEDEPLPKIVAKKMLPDFIVGYSSGENEILSLPFFKMRFLQLDEYMESLHEQLSYPGKPESRHTYLDSSFSQAILICNLLFQDENALEPFREVAAIESLQQFRIILKHSIEIPSDQLMYFNSFPDELVFKGSDDAGREAIDFKILAGFTELVERLKSCSTSFYHDAETNTLCLDYWVNQATKDAFKNNFESAIDLFQSFQILLTLNLYSVSEELKRDLYTSNSLYVNETVPTLPSDERVMRFKDVVLKKKGVDSVCYAKSLSDGEHQFLHSLGLCLLYKDTNSLFLLDEPETHFNPDWRSKFISRLRDCFANADAGKEREMLITTHTPFLVSDSKKEQVLIFKKENAKVEVDRPKYNTLGASVDQITMLSFEKSETIGGYAATKISEFEKRFQDGENREELIKEINQELGDSIEKLFLIKTIRKSLKEK